MKTLPLIRSILLTSCLLLAFTAQALVKTSFSCALWPGENTTERQTGFVSATDALTVLAYYIINSEGNIIAKDSVTTSFDTPFSHELEPGDYTICLLGQGKQNAYLGLRYDIRPLKNSSSVWLQTWQEARHTARYDYYYTRLTFKVTDKPITHQIILKRITAQLMITVNKNPDTRIASVSVGFDKNSVYNTFNADSVWSVANETTPNGLPDAIFETTALSDGNYILNTFPGTNNVAGRIYISYQIAGKPLSKTIPFAGIQILPGSRTLIRINL